MGGLFFMRARHCLILSTLGRLRGGLLGRLCVDLHLVLILWMNSLFRSGNWCSSLTAEAT